MKRTVNDRSPQQAPESSKLPRIDQDVTGLKSDLNCLLSNKMAAILDMDYSVSSEHIQDQLGPHTDDKSLALVNAILNLQAEQFKKLTSNVSKQTSELIEQAVAAATKPLEMKYNTLLTKHNVLVDRVINMEMQERRNNLIISGISEQVGHTYEDLSLWFHKFCKEKLKVNDEIIIERIHRLGAPPREGDQSNRPRPPRLIIVRFAQFQQKMKVFGARRELKETRIFLDDDYPAEIRQIRRHLLPIAKEARDVHKMMATVRVNRLIINGASYTKDQLHLLPKCLFEVAHSSTWTEDVVGFFRKECPLSNHNPSPFILDNEPYSCIEEHLLSEEALLFGDEMTANNIRATDDPVEMLRHRKHMIRNNPRYNRAEFEIAAPEILLKGLRAKFAQNDYNREFLLKTGTRQIVEASPYDRFFGIGYGHRDKNFLTRRDDWGNNALGKGLMAVREELK